MKTQTFNLIKDEKCTIWHRSKYKVEAATLEEAINLINTTDIEAEETEFLHDTVEEMTTKENDNQATIEVFKDSADSVAVFINK